MRLLSIGYDTITNLRIAQIAPIAGPVNGDTGHSIEHLVYLLTEELVRRGHNVTLFATGDSQTSAHLASVYRHGYNDDEELWNWSFHETMHVAAAFERAADFDVIHSHDYEFALPFVRLTATPVLHSYHVLPNEDIAQAYSRCPHVYVVALSAYQRSYFHGLQNVEVIHHGVATDSFPFCAERGDYLLYLGQIVPGKGPTAAIQLARETGMPLILAGPGENDYFQTEVAPLIDGRQVKYVGPVGRRERDALLASAAALVNPVVVPEPFGLVMIEAMSCGTPVIAFDKGAVSEVVDSGVTGYYAPDLAALVAFLPATLALDRERVRQVAVERFDYHRMTSDYERMYHHLADERENHVS